MKKKGSTFFNIIIGITVIALLSALGYALYYWISNYIAVKEAEEAVEEFERKVTIVALEDEIENKNQEEQVVEEQEEEEDDDDEGTSQSSSRRSTVYYKNYVMVGTIQIPRTGVKAPIVDRVTPSSITSAVGVLYGPGLNEIGNTVLAAHNYRNGTFFSNNKKLEEGDLIYITDSDGDCQEYTIYNTYIAAAEDFSYATRNTNGKREISLSTCTTDASTRLVIWARES